MEVAGILAIEYRSSEEALASLSCSLGSAEEAESVESVMPRPSALTLADDEEDIIAAGAPGAEAEEDIGTAPLLASLGEEIEARLLLAAGAGCCKPG